MGSQMLMFAVLYFLFQKVITRRFLNAIFLLDFIAFPFSGCGNPVEEEGEGALIATNIFFLLLEDAIIYFVGACLERSKQSKSGRENCLMISTGIAD